MTDFNSCSESALLKHVLTNGLLEDPTDPADLEAFENKLGIVLPSLFRSLLLRSNGGEFCFARVNSDFVPKSMASLTSEKLWDEVFKPFDYQFDANGLNIFKGKILPIGDDYSGELIFFDLRDKNNYQLRLATDKLKNLNQIDSCESYGSFNEAVINSLEESEKPVEDANSLEKLPAPATYAAEIQRIKNILGKSAEKILPFCWKNQSHYGHGLWFEVTRKPAAFCFQLSIKKVEVNQFAYFRISTPKEEHLITVNNGGFVKETFKNIYLANDRCNDGTLRGFEESPLGFDKGYPEQMSPKVCVYEVRLVDRLNVDYSNMKFCVLALSEGFVYRLRFEVGGTNIREHINKIVIYLLSFGPDWWK
jgi:hypothetical protein